MKQKIKNFLLGLIPFVVLVIVWFFGCFFNFFPGWLIPNPFKTFQIFLSLFFDGTVLRLVYLSAINCLPAFVFSFFIATILGLLIGSNKLIDKIFSPFLSAIYLIPSLAWLPFLLLIFGFTRQTIWVVIIISAFNKIIYSVIEGARGVPENWLLAGRNVGLSKRLIIRKIILPATLPSIITGARLGFGSSWRSLIGAEMLVASLGGLGRFLWLSQGMMNYGKVFSGIFIIALIGFLMEYLIFRNLEKVTIKRWGLLRDEERNFIAK